MYCCAGREWDGHGIYTYQYIIHHRDGVVHDDVVDVMSTRRDTLRRRPVADRHARRSQYQ